MSELKEWPDRDATIEDIWKSYEKLYNWLGAFLDVEADEIDPLSSKDVGQASEAFEKAVWVAHFNDVRKHIQSLEQRLKQTKKDEVVIRGNLTKALLELKESQSKCEALEAERDGLREIGTLINTQNNRITQDPIFAVQRQVIDWGYDSDYSDEYEWVNADDPEESYKEGEPEYYELEEKEEDGELESKWFKGYFKYRWEFVTCCFTEKGCEDYIKANGHNLGKTRIYAYSAYRNSEWIRLRKIFSGLTQQDNPKEIEG